MNCITSGCCESAPLINCHPLKDSLKENNMPDYCYWMEEALGNCIVPSVVFRPIVRASVLYTKYCVHIFCILCFSCNFFFFIYFCPYISKISLLINIFVLFCLLLIAFVLILQFLLFVVIFPTHSICMYVFFHFIPSPSTHLTTIRKKY